MEKDRYGVNDADGPTNDPSSKSPEELSTTDLNVACALVHKGFEYKLRLEDPSASLEWVFVRTPEIEQVVADYTLQRLSVEPRRWQLTFKRLVSEMRAFLWKEGVYHGG